MSDENETTTVRVPVEAVVSNEFDTNCKGKKTNEVIDCMNGGCGANIDTCCIARDTECFGYIAP